MTHNATPTPLTRRVAARIVEELRTHDDICIRVSGFGYAYPFVRYADGDWQWAHYDKRDRVEGRTLSDDDMISMVATHSFHLLNTTDAVGGLTDKGPTIWEDAAHQDVFTDYTRCFWCGASERTTTLTQYQTTEDGQCNLCPECFTSFDECDQIITEQTADESS